MAVAAIASVGMGAYSLATAPGMPESPDLAGASRAGTEAEAETLADRRRLEAAARQGGTATYQTAAQKDVAVEKQFVRLPSARMGGGAEVPYVESEWKQGGKYFEQFKTEFPGYKPTVTTRTVKMDMPGETKTADFTGYGEADVQGRVAEQMAKNLLDLDKKYGSQFIEEALKQQALADPEGTAARGKLYELIKQQAEKNPERPVADLLDTQVSDQLRAGKGLDATSQRLLDEAIKAAAESRGSRVEGTEWDEPMTTGFEGQRRLDAAQQKALGWLTSGATPEDVEYRREQQTLGNLSNFVQGRTPQSQFGSLSAAQNGPTPVRAGPALPLANGGTGQAAQGAAMQTYGTQLNNDANQMNPWMAGLSTLLSGAGVAGNAGWKPLAA